MKKEIPALIFLLALNFRPAILGQTFGEFWIAFTIILVFLWALTVFKIKMNEFNRLLLWSFFLFYFYICLQSFYLTKRIVEPLIVTVFNFIGLLPILFISRKSYDYILNFILKSLLVASILYVITYLLFFINEKYAFTLFNFEVPTNKEISYYQLKIIFPFSPVYVGRAVVGSYSMPRAIGFFREPGIFQLFLIVIFFIHYSKNKKTDIFLFSIILLLLFTFSTAGLALFVFGMLIYFFMMGKISLGRVFLTSIFIIPASIFMVFTTSQFGIITKFQNKSGLDRIGAILDSFEILKTNALLGVGYGNTKSYTFEAVNFIGSLGQIGLLGFIIYLIPYLYVFVKIKSSEFLAPFVALIATIFFSQPIYDKPISYIMLFFIYHSYCDKYKADNLITKEKVIY